MDYSSNANQYDIYLYSGRTNILISIYNEYLIALGDLLLSSSQVFYMGRVALKPPNDLHAEN